MATTTPFSSIIVHKRFETESSYIQRQHNNHNCTDRGTKYTPYVTEAAVDLLATKAKLGDRLEFINGVFSPSDEGTTITLDDDVQCTLVSCERSKDTTSLASIMLEFKSSKMTPTELTFWINSMHENYMKKIQNDLGAGLFYFNHAMKPRNAQLGYADPRGAPDSISKDTLSQMMLSNAPKHLSFVKSKFVSNKTFDNLYGVKMHRIKERLDHFLNNRKWYDDRGIPYQLTIMLSGPPGRGKSSVVRAIANRSRRHIVNVAFHSIRTATQLKNLMYSPYIDVFVDEDQRNGQKFGVPLEKRITVFDEVDANSDILKERSIQSMPHSDTNNDELTLADVLSSFDGAVENPGCIRVVNTNFPEMLDSAFTRPGRIDLNVEFDDSDDQEIAVEMFNDFFDRQISKEWKERLAPLKMSPADIHAVFFNHFNERDDEVILSDLLRENDKQGKKKVTTPPNYYQSA